MASRPHRSFLARWSLPLVVGPLLTFGAMGYLYRHLGQPTEGKAPTILDFGKVEAPDLKLKKDGAIIDIGNVPPPGQQAPKVRTGAAVNDPLLARGQVDEAEPAPVVDIEFPRITITDSVHFRALRDKQPIVVTLKGVTGPLFMEICTDAASVTWKCGARARAELARLVGPRSIGCVEPTPLDDGNLSADCYVGARNLSEWMVQQGWADPIDPGDSRLKPLYDEARAAKRGRFGLAPTN